ncbi:unnamed protein product [Rotaria sp. Silwood2]|nr:unnamed protein product [Rotaria sp. Silwood2]
MKAKSTTTSYQLLNRQFKIPRIKRITNTVKKESKKYPDVTITQSDIFRMFFKLTILFIGDSSIRTIYRDFVRLFSNGRLLEITEAAMQNGEFKEAEGERRLQKDGKRGNPNYKDIREYFCEASSTRLIYIHLPTVHGPSATENLNYLQESIDCEYIHAIVFSSYHSDMNFAKLKKNKLPFETILENYNNSLNDICLRLMEICRAKKDRHQQYIWMGAHPPNFTFTDKQQYQFNEILNSTNQIVNEHGFHTFNRKHFWDITHNDLLMRESHYFSPKGDTLL